MSFPRYGEYKDSRVAWLGTLPTHWAVDRVKHVTASIEQGWSPQCEGFPVDTPDEWGVMKVGCVNGGRFRPSENKKLPAELQPMLQYALKRGDLLISRANTRELVGSAAVVQDDFDNLLLCDKLYRLRTNEGMSQAKYLAYFLGTREARSQIELDATGASSSMLNIGQSAILDLLMPRPSAAEQSAIATFLDRETAKIDALIAEQEKLIALLAEKRRATISHAVTKGLNPNAPMKDSSVEWLGEVPAHWEAIRVKGLSQFTTSGPRGWSERITDDGSLFIQSGDLNDSLGLDYETAKRVDVGDDAEAARTRLSEGDVVVCITGAKTGNVALCSSLCEPAYVNQHLCLIRPNAEVVGRFFALTLKSTMCQAQFAVSQYGLKQGLSLENVRELWVARPPRDEQQAIVEFLDAELNKFMSLAFAAEAGISLLKERRSALIAAAVTGQIDVRNT